MVQGFIIRGVNGPSAFAITRSSVVQGVVVARIDGTSGLAVSWHGVMEGFVVTRIEGHFGLVVSGTSVVAQGLIQIGRCTESCSTVCDPCIRILILIISCSA